MFWREKLDVPTSASKLFAGHELVVVLVYMAGNSSTSGGVVTCCWC